MQIPVGMLLDRYGPRRVEPVLLAVAAAGALAVRAARESLAGLAIARALIGAGVCACLMAPLKAIATWYPRGAAGVASPAGSWWPAAWARWPRPRRSSSRCASRGWRNIFVGLAARDARRRAAASAWRVPDIAKPRARGRLRARSGPACARVFVHPRFWWIAPLGGFGMGSFMAIQGLWAVPWLMEVEGATRARRRRDHLLVMSVVITRWATCSLGLFGTRLARRGVHARHLFAAGFALARRWRWPRSCLRLPGGYLWWSLYGLGAVGQRARRSRCSTKASAATWPAARTRRST